MSQNSVSSEWREFMDREILQYANDPTVNIQFWCDWRLELNKILCEDAGKSIYSHTRSEILKRQIMKGNKWNKKDPIPFEPQKGALTMNKYLHVYYGIPRLTTTLNNIRATREYTTIQPRDQDKVRGIEDTRIERFAHSCSGSQIIYTHNLFMFDKDKSRIWCNNYISPSQIE